MVTSSEQFAVYSDTENYIRIAISTPQTLKILEDGLKKLKAIFDKSTIEL